MKKGQSDVVGFVIITLIILIVVSGTFFWARGMIETNNDFNDVTRMENRMREINKAIEEVANEQGQRSINLDLNEGWLFIEDNSTLTYSADLELPYAKHGSDSVLIGNGSSEGPCLSTSYGILGTDNIGCLIENGEVNIKLKYIILNETSSNNCYNIVLESGGTAAARKGTHNLLIKYDRTETNSATGCTQLITKVINIDME